MSFIQEHSCLATRPELDLFTNLPTQASVEDSITVEHLPSTLSDDSPIKFSISGDSNYYIDLQSSYLYLEVKVTNNDGSNLNADAAVGPINLLGQTLFRQVDLFLNDSLVSDASNLYHYRAMFETLLSYGDEARNSQLSMSLFNKDTANAMDNYENDNTGLVARRALTAESKTVQLIGKIHSDLFFQNRYLLNGVDLKIKLIRNSNPFVLMAEAASNYKLKICNASMFVRKVKVNSGIQLKHIEKLDKQQKMALYPIRRVVMKTFNIATGSLSYNEENLFTGVLPKRIVIGMVDAESFEGAYNLNPFNFKHKNLKYCSLLVDGKMIPQKALDSNFQNGSTLRNYFTLLESTGKAFRNDGIAIDRTEYNNGYSLVSFDLTPIQEEDGCYHLIKKGNARLELKFSQGLDRPVNVIVYAEFDSTIKIDRSRAVLTQFYS